MQEPPKIPSFQIHHCQERIQVGPSCRSSGLGARTVNDLGIFVRAAKQRSLTWAIERGTADK
ncbi:hypothetical protein AAKU64_004537 [Undibacterium sp. GrIS 1.8]